MFLKTRFKFWSFFVIGLLIAVTWLLMYIIGKAITKQNFPHFSVFIFIALFLFTWIWLVFGELRTKIIRAEIQESEIIVSNFFGFGTKNIYNLNEFEGFETTFLPSKWDSYEYLYLIKDGKKIIKFSDYYHRNFKEIKTVLASKMQNLGLKEFSLWIEVKEIFK